MEAALAATAAPVCPRRPRCPRVTGAQGRRCNGKERTVQPWGRRLLFVPSEQGQFLSGFSVSLLLSSAHCLSSLPPPRGGSGRRAHRGASPWAGPSRRGHPSGRPLCVSQVPRAITSRLDDARHSVFTALRTRGQEGAVPNTRRTPRKVSSSGGGGGGEARVGMKSPCRWPACPSGQRVRPGASSPRAPACSPAEGWPAHVEVTHWTHARCGFLFCWDCCRTTLHYSGLWTSLSFCRSEARGQGPGARGQGSTGSSDLLPRQHRVRAT